MKTIREIAEEILDAKEKEKSALEQLLEQKYRKTIDGLRKEFEIAFKEYLPLLSAEGIKWSPQLVDKRYEHLGSYILFTKGSSELRMDFSNSVTYRYCNASKDEHKARMAYGKWPKEGLVMYIYENLLKDEEEDLQEEGFPVFLTEEVCNKGLEIIDTVRGLNLECVDKSHVYDLLVLCRITELLIESIDWG